MVFELTNYLKPMMKNKSSSFISFELKRNLKNMQNKFQ